ncbi:MAG TPA: hypothetical protein VFJ28_15870 [Marmoricola sp.]|nr:hypothetical protein [Marmoricola sp.]
MALSRHHRIALVGACATSAIALGDAVVHGLTGDNSVFSDDSGRSALIALGGIVHGLTYVALAAVLVAERVRFVGTNLVARGARWVLMGGLAVLAIGFLLVVPVLAFAGQPEGAVGAAWAGTATVGFLAMILGSLTLGLALLRTSALGVGARVLAMMLPVAGLTALVAYAAPSWAHPAYVETTLHFGIALLGVSASRVAQPPKRAATASPTAAV